MVKVKALQPIAGKYQVGDVFEVTQEKAERLEFLEMARVIEKKQVEAPPKDKMIRGTKATKKKK